MSQTYSREEKKSRIKGIVGAASGNLVEWFDFYIYAVFAAYFTHALTAPDMDSTTKAIYVWGVFGASFFMRPIGSWLFGRIADRQGRKQSMVISICLMALSSFLFAALPTYDQVGMWAPFLLLMIRLLQGLSVGGEYGAVATYMSELGLKGQRGFFASFQYVTLSGGQLLASLLGVILLGFMTEQQLNDGGWRIPFVIGGVAALLSLAARSRLEETLSHEDAEREESGSLIALLKQHWKTFLLVVGYTSISGLVKAEMFPPHVRALGVGFSYAVGNALFGGSAPSVALIFKDAGIENIFFIYVIFMLMICFLCSLALPKKPEYLEHDH